MIYKGLMGRDEIDYLTNRFTEIKFANLRVGTETLATKEMLSEKDISPEVYNNILNDNREGVLKLISHSQGLIAFDYDIGSGKTVLTYLNEVIQGSDKVILLNLLKKSFDTKKIIDDKTTTRLNTDRRRGTMFTEISDYSYSVLETTIGDEQDFKLQINFNQFKNIVEESLAYGPASSRKVIVAIYPFNSEYGFKIHTFPVEAIPSISKLQKSKGVNILSKRNAQRYLQEQGLRLNQTSEMVKNDLYLLAPSIDFELDFDEKYGVSSEAFPLFRRWAKRLVKRKMERKNGAEDVLIVFSLNDSYVDKGLNKLFGTKPINTQYTLFSENTTFKEWASKKLMQPATIERIKSSLEDSVTIFKETTGKYKPLPKNLFQDKKYEIGKRLLAELITAKIGLAMGDRSGWTKRSSRPPSLQSSEYDRYSKLQRGIKKSLPDLTSNLSFLVEKSNKKGYDSLTETEKVNFAKYWQRWVTLLNVFDQMKYRIFLRGDGSGVRFLVDEIVSLGIYPNKVDKLDSVFVFSINMFHRNAPNERISSDQSGSKTQERKKFQNFIFIINYDRQEISVNKYGGQDDAKQFSINFQDFDIRVDIVNLINRIISLPKNLITNLPEKPYYSGREGDTPISRVSMTPEEVATTYSYSQANAMKNHEEVLYHEEVKQDTLTGRREGFMVFRERRGGYGFFSFDPFYHDKDGHGAGRVDLCITPLNNLFTPLRIWAESNGWFELKNMPNNLFGNHFNSKEIILKYISGMCEDYLFSYKPKLYAISAAVCILSGQKDVTSPDLNWLLGNRGAGEGEVFPIDVNAYEQMPTYSKETVDYSIFSFILNRAWNEFRQRLELLRQYPLAMPKEPDFVEIRRITGLALTEQEIREEVETENLRNLINELNENVYKSNSHLTTHYKKLSNKLIKEYLKQNPPKATNLATRRT